MDALPDVDAIIVPVGGGGLIAGVATGLFMSELLLSSTAAPAAISASAGSTAENRSASESKRTKIRFI